MAKPIAATPTFEGEDLKDLIEYSEAPLTEEEIKYKDKLKKSRYVPIFGI